MRATLPSPRSSRNTLGDARRDCDHLITAVEHALIGRSDHGAELIYELEAGANRLLVALESLGVPLGDRLEYFRDFVVADHRSARPLTKLGLPVNEDDWGIPSLDLALGCAWLGQMRDLRDSLDDHKLCRSGPSLERGGGRKKDPAVLRLESEVAACYTREAESLAKNGVTQPDIRKHLKLRSTTDILRRLNEDRNTPYPVHGPEADKLRKQVTRSPAWRRLHGPTSIESAEEAPELLAKMNAEWALENGLRPTRARQN